MVGAEKGTSGVAEKLQKANQMKTREISGNTADRSRILFLFLVLFLVVFLHPKSSTFGVKGSEFSDLFVGNLPVAMQKTGQSL